MPKAELITSPTGLVEQCMQQAHELEEIGGEVNWQQAVKIYSYTLNLRQYKPELEANPHLEAEIKLARANNNLSLGERLRAFNDFAFACQMGLQADAPDITLESYAGLVAVYRAGGSYLSDADLVHAREYQEIGEVFFNRPGAFIDFGFRRAGVRFFLQSGLLASQQGEGEKALAYYDKAQALIGTMLQVYRPKYSEEVEDLKGQVMLASAKEHNRLGQNEVAETQLKWAFNQAIARHHPRQMEQAALAFGDLSLSEGRHNRAHFFYQYALDIACGRMGYPAHKAVAEIAQTKREAPFDHLPDEVERYIGFNMYLWAQQDCEGFPDLAQEMYLKSLEHAQSGQMHLTNPQWYSLIYAAATLHK